METGTSFVDWPGDYREVIGISDAWYQPIFWWIDCAYADSEGLPLIEWDAVAERNRDKIERLQKLGNFFETKEEARRFRDRISALFCESKAFFEPIVFRRPANPASKYPRIRVSEHQFASGISESLKEGESSTPGLLP